ncbi:hypothetical protein D6C90_00839 [Aureobasidium pullulans]|uniref:F-box domain-containing protein n=1 Tax=Aureobasidium pullulans TaxID=5580 RepID=A0A4S9EEH4_AURPU|nr:hypothetical protein D6D15_01400 [Aureobasidium pullulans]THX32340.1 hypothetical protein D6D12_02232 [Aureobasidium pullulans]THZ52947.1 hypothetical protein D6C90_00839 [Aureobasidium pullulans]
MALQPSTEELGKVEVIEISSSSPSHAPSHDSELDLELHQDLKNDNSAGEISSIASTATSDYTMPMGGTSFLDLPLELRTMVYDLAIPKDYRWNFRMPGKPKTVVKGINLLQSCRQVRQETQDRVWCHSLCIDCNESLVNMGAVMSGLNSTALAKIPIVRLSITIDPDASSSWGPIDLTVLSDAKLLYMLDLEIDWSNLKRCSFTPSKDTAFFTGLVIQIMTQIPQHVKYVFWNLYYYNECWNCAVL